ncbi:Checkpoint serine/threonine-protein kinase BUB1 [Nakaseomyces bracarensis]|uniref:Checkpoint serine/threonine-protein kinase BUB1 n=1 Tax=Nakaseomyces bracarensis TaxID=273131 RepID=A0ABR4NSW5_9SACH
MAGKQKITHFDDLEYQKENIVPIREGRSAHRLVRALGLNEENIKEQRAVYMTRILTEFDKNDDPLALYLEYIDWINHTFPQGGSNQQSGMLSVLEDCIIRIKDMERYCNDPRYLKIWLWYMELFTMKYKADCRDIFFFMLRNRIGDKLAILYEELSGLLIELKQFKYAVAILDLGIKQDAKPVSNLMHRKEKLLDTNGLVDSGIISTETLIPEAEKLILGSSKSALVKKKMEQDQIKNTDITRSDIYKDAEDIEEGPIYFHNWSVFETLRTRNKENHTPISSISTKRNRSTIDNATSSKRTTIFQDDLGRSKPQYKVIELPGKKKETVDFNIDLLFIDLPDKEQCTEELLSSIYKRRNIKEELEIIDQEECDLKRKKVCLAEKN